MAKLIPEQPSQLTDSAAEKKLFRLFQMMEDTDTWTILHSLSIAKHISQSQGEADFVAIIPSAGVFFLEVKGGRISHRDGKWFSTDRHECENEIHNPVEQANKAMHSVKNYIKETSLNREIDRSLVGFGVIFPDISIHGTIKSVEIADEQIADYDDCLTSKDLKAYLLRLAHFWKDRSNYNFILPTVTQCRELVNLLRPDFVGHVCIRSLIRNIQNQVIELTDNQQDVFETITENERCVIRGGAGTGKTVIALHFARQLAEERNKTAFFCYNRQLACYLQDNIGSQESLVCNSFTEYMEAIAEMAGHVREAFTSYSAKDRYYRVDLPQIFMESFLQLNLAQFDYLILDEAQDLITENYLEALDFVLKDGLSNGKWYFFMDAEKQNLFNHGQSETEVLDLLHHYQKNYTKCLLRDNCRNSVAIIEKVDSVFGSNTRHKHNNERGAEVSIKSYRKTSDETEALETILRTLNREGVPLEQITILSPSRFQNSVASLVQETPVTTIDSERKTAVFFSTIHSFKGLESPVVILSDIDALSDDNKMNILYVGMTRAQSVLYILAQERAAKLLR